MNHMSENKNGFNPIKVIAVDIDLPIQDIKRQSAADAREYSRAMILVRLHRSPIGILELDIPQDGLGSAEVVSAIHDRFAQPIKEHLLNDQIALPDATLDAPKITPRCLREQEELLADAPFISVVIATRDRAESLQECLKSVLRLDYPNYEVIVVDNAPQTNATENLIRSNPEFAEKIRYLREDIPGLAIAHNRALAHTSAPIMAITDDDVILDSHWLKSIAANFQRDSETACVTGMILPFEIATRPQLWIEQFGGFGKGFHRKLFDKGENRPDDFLFPYSAGQFGSGANMAFRTSALLAVGGFDATLGAGTPAGGGDDLAIFFDMIAHGYRLTYEPAAILYHKHRPDYPGLANQAYGYGLGLSAFLTRIILSDPRTLLDILMKAPAGLRHLLDPKSRKNSKKHYDYPDELTKLELKGFLNGPFAYLRSRRLTSRHARISRARHRKSWDCLPAGR